MVTLDFFFLNWLRTRGWLWTVLIATFAYYGVRLVMFYPNGPYPMVYDQRCYLFKGLQIIKAALFG